MEEFFEALAWLAQIALFLMLGLLVTPHDAAAAALAIATVAAVLILVARPVASVRLPAAVRVRPARRGVRRLGRAARRGADLPHHHPGAGGRAGGGRLFGIAFGIVVASLRGAGLDDRPAPGCSASAARSIAMSDAAIIAPGTPTVRARHAASLIVLRGEESRRC